MPYGIDMVQARDVWDANRDGAIDAGAPTGEGILVCVVDSGLFAGHEDFQGVNIVGGIPGKTGVRQLRSWHARRRHRLPRPTTTSAWSA